MSGVAFEHEVLDRCGNDFEAPHTIVLDLTRDLGRPVTESEVRAAFLSLAAKGLVQAYTFEASTSRYVPISSVEATHADAPWFTVKK
jgi:hypothetical protein